MNEEGQGFKKFLTAYFDFLEKGILIYEQSTDLELIGLEDGEGSLLQRERNFLTHLLYLTQSSYTKETPIYKLKQVHGKSVNMLLVQHLVQLQE